VRGRTFNLAAISLLENPLLNIRRTSPCFVPGGRPFRITNISQASDIATESTTDNYCTVVVGAAGAVALLGKPADGT
jgi:hypothetical protein